MSISEQLDKASAQLKRLSDRASEAEANANAKNAKDKAALKQRVDAAEADAKKASDDLKASAKKPRTKPLSGGVKFRTTGSPTLPRSASMQTRPRQI